MKQNIVKMVKNSLKKKYILPVEFESIGPKLTWYQLNNRNSAEVSVRNVLASKGMFSYAANHMLMDPLQVDRASKVH